MKISNRITIGTLSLLLIVGFLFIFQNKKIILLYHQEEKSDDISFYYQDTVCIDSLFPEYTGLPFYIQDTSFIAKGRHVFLRDPCRFSNNETSVKIRFMSKPVVEKTVKVKNWRERKNYLREITDVPYYKGSKISQFINFITEKITNSNYGVVALGDSLYYFDYGSIYMDYRGVKTRLKSSINLEWPEYNQMIKANGYIFFRNGSKIHVTTNNFETYKTIYNDRRGIKESMVWDDINNVLLFTMYTSGAERKRHYLLSYDPASEVIDTLQTFYTYNDYKTQGLRPYCRHIHLLCKDPYTGYLFIGVGDYNEEPAIYMSNDGGKSLLCVGRGTQNWRTLSIFFTDKSIYWTTDTETPQYIIEISRSMLSNLPILESNIKKYPIINSAIWWNLKLSDDEYLVGSNSEGCYYDDFHRIYLLHFNVQGPPTVYSVFEEKSLEQRDLGIKYHQTAPLFLDYNNNLWCYDTHLGYRQFKFNKK